MRSPSMLMLIAGASLHLFGVTVVASPIVIGCDPEEITVLVGDGSPQVDMLHTQVSDTEFCATADTCGPSFTEGHTVTIGFSATVPLTEWISGGFDVSESTTYSDSYPCTTGKGNHACIWAATPNKAYTVKNVYNTCADGGDPFVLHSPLNDDPRKGYYCVTGSDCRANGDAYWEYNVG